MTASRPALVVGALLLALLLFAVAITGALYRGSGSAFGVFTLAFLALGVLVLPRPRLYVYTFLAAFLLLGFWLKVVLHVVWDPGFVEPVGGFSYAPQEWDSGLFAAASGAAGLAFARAGHLWMAHQDARLSSGPSWFGRWRVAAWVLTIVLIVAVNAANLHFAFYQVGVKPKMLLPLRGHVLLAWLVNIGFALWIAALVWWELRSRRSLGRSLLAPIGEALLSAISTFSRLTFLLHSVPYALAILERRSEMLVGIKRRSIYVLLGAIVLLFGLSVITVFALRVYQYYGYAAGVSQQPFIGHVIHTIKKQVPLLLTHRWVGLEGVLAVSSAPERSPALLAQALRESPKLAGQSLFQRVAQTRYLSENPAQFVFLGNAGPIAVFWFSGSLALVFFGMAAVGVAALATEVGAGRLTGNPFLLAVAGAALANVVVQTTFFYLTLVFLLQLWVGIGFIAALQRLDLGNSRKG